MNYISTLFNKIYYYFFPPNNLLVFNYDNIPLFEEFTNLDNNINFQNFKKDDQELNNTIFALNNLQEVIYEIFFETELERNLIGSKLLNIIINQNVNSSYSDIRYHNLDFINESYFSRFYYIKVDIIKKDSPINHVNSIIIDRNKKYILYFEPKCKMKVDIIKIKKLLSNYFDLTEFNFLIPDDIGFTNKKKLQRLDLFCQSYILFTFWLIIRSSDHYNPKIKNMDIKNIGDHILENINTKTLGYFLYIINQKIKEKSILLSDVPIIWKFPSNNIMNTIKSLKILNNKKNKVLENKEFNFEIEEDEKENLIIIKKV